MKRFASARFGRPIALALVASTAMLSACAGLDAGQQSDDATQQVAVPGSPEARAILALVNDPKVGLRELDIDAGLTKTAAVNILAHRNGPDGIVGTADDNPFEDITELDAVSGVGDATLRALLAYADANGYLDAQHGKRI